MNKVGFREEQEWWEPMSNIRYKVHARPFEPQSKVIFGRFRQLLAINVHKMAPRTNQWLQERTWDTPTQGLLSVQGSIKHLGPLPESQGHNLAVTLLYVPHIRFTSAYARVLRGGAFL